MAMRITFARKEWEPWEIFIRIDDRHRTERWFLTEFIGTSSQRFKERKLPALKEWLRQGHDIIIKFNP